MQVSVGSSTKVSLRILLTLVSRARHVKCDEQRPACSNCTKRGHKCDGYAPPPNSHGQRTSRLAPPDVSASLDLSVRKVDIILPGTSNERRHFHYFQQRTVADLAGYFDSAFWYQLVLQISHCEPAVRHGIIALGSLHETLDKGGREFGLRSLPIAERDFSVQQYSRSVTSLRSRLASEEESNTLEIALICCIIFNSFETIYGNHDQALLHLQSGLKILQQWKADRKQSTILPNKPSSAQCELSQVFSRLNILARSLLDPDPPSFHNITDNFCVTTVPDIFTDLTQARDILYSMYHDGFAFFQKMLEQKRSGTFTNVTSGGQPYNPLAEFGRLDSDSIKWLSAFDNYVARFAPTMDSRELRGATLLRIHYLFGFINLHKSLQPEQGAFDTYNSHFDQMVSLSSTLMRSSEGPDPKSTRPGFSLDLGIIAPLYYTAMSCRDPHIRRRAVSVLSSPRHEGPWSAIDAAKTGSLAIQIEEKGLGEIQCSGNIPESSRLLGISTIGSDGDRIRLRCVFSGNIPPEKPTVKELWLDSCVYVQDLSFGELIRSRHAKKTD